MAGDWEETTLGECAVWLSGGTPFKGNEAFWSGPIPWVSAKDMKSFRLHDAEDHISPLAVGNGGKLVPAGTILLLVRGMTLHNDVPICMITREMAFNQDIKALQPAKNVDGAFLAYWLLANKPELLASVDHAGHGTGRLVTDTLKEKQVLLPPLAKQKAIAAVLGALDDKIELNRRMNATLEAMARALFQSWFVDFDPVRAKLDGREPTGLDPETAALFSESFQDSEVGHIPSGWKITTLGACIGFRSGFSFKSQDWQESGVPVVKIGSVKPGIIDLSQVSYVSEEIAQLAARYRLSTGDMLIGMTGYVGEVGLVPPSNNPPLLNQRVGKFVMPKAGTESLAFWYCTTRQPEFRAFVEARSHGTAQANVSGEAIMEFPLVAPAPEILVAFNRECQPMLDRILSNHAESRTLAILRDTLLPKLLRGEMSSALAVDLA
jgi:type I restriction enzyme S subunit